MKDLSVVFMGTPEFAVPVLDMLIKETNVKLVVTQPDKLVGRKREIEFSPIKKSRASARPLKHHYFYRFSISTRLFKDSNSCRFDLTNSP